MTALTLDQYCEFRRVSVEEAARLCTPELGFEIDRRRSSCIEVSPGARVDVMKVYREEGE